MIIQRDYYLNQLIAKRENGKIKVITGIRRCGKSFLLANLYKPYLQSCGVAESQIVQIALDNDISARYRNPVELSAYLHKLAEGHTDMFYFFLDEIQYVAEIENPWLPGTGDTIGFVDVLLGLMELPNVDIYVTGSNSKMLSSDIMTQFRDRGDEISVSPLSFKEYVSVYTGSLDDAWREYYTYGGMPAVLQFDAHEVKARYLQNLFANTYLQDVLERHNIRNHQDVLDDLLNIVSSAVGSLTNPYKLSNTFKSVKKEQIEPATISKYLTYFEEAFLIKKAHRFDVKGKKYINTPLKYYFMDLGLRNARLGFRQLEESHIMENIIFNELVMRGMSVDVGVVEQRSKDNRGKEQRSQLEIDFIANSGIKTYYIQSALTIEQAAKKEQEIRPLKKVTDSFKKIVIVRDHIMPWMDEYGIYYLGVRDFLMNEKSLDE